MQCYRRQTTKQQQDRLAMNHDIDHRRRTNNIGETTMILIGEVLDCVIRYIYNPKDRDVIECVSRLHLCLQVVDVRHHVVKYFIGKSCIHSSNAAFSIIENSFMTKEKFQNWSYYAPPWIEQKLKSKILSPNQPAPN